jgi:hypothetical protein
VVDVEGHNYIYFGDMVDFGYFLELDKYYFLFDLLVWDKFSDLYNFLHFFFHLD